MTNPGPFDGFEDSRALAQAIVDTIREPLLVLDRDLRVVAASRSFYRTFKMNRQDVQGRAIYALGNGQWDIPQLRLLLERILPQHAVMDGYEVEQDFSVIGRRTMVLNARTVFYEKHDQALILLAIEDITERRTAERGLAELLEQKETLLQEMQHRVANSLQIIASILLLKARTVRSDETRLHLQDAHRRVMSVAAVQQQLQASRHGRALPDRPLSLAAVRHPGRLDDRRGSAHQGRSSGRCRRRLVQRSRQHRADRDRADDQRAEARLRR
jgi:chemotaxis protein methyltransferase CheR